jgi:hypothetical protein
MELEAVGRNIRLRLSHNFRPIRYPHDGYATERCKTLEQIESYQWQLETAPTYDFRPKPRHGNRGIARGIEFDVFT